MKERKKLSSARWLVIFFVTLVLLAALFVPVFNLAVDPYGAFGDRLFGWWSYDFTLNPRLAKISYLKQNADKYDSFIVGSSGSSSIPVADLNEYLGANFFNCMFYGTETATFEQTANYLLTTYRPKNLVLNLSLMTAHTYSVDEKDLTNSAHPDVSGESAFAFYLRYLFASPADSLAKVKYRISDGYLQTPYKVFNQQTGAYDKSRRDAEPIGDLGDYLSRDAYAVFKDYPKANYSLYHVREAVEAVARIKAKAEQTGTRLFVLCQPTYKENLDYFSKDDQAAFFNALAEVTDYWDFTLTPASYDPRYFYDSTHSRGVVGKMELAVMFGDDSVYRPEPFGRYVEQGSAPGAPECDPLPEEEYTATVPIICYHQIVKDGETNASTATEATFESHMKALSESGFTPVSIYDLKAYVENGADLPEKPVLITFDDGYLGNYEIAFPILKEYGFKATIFAIGVSVGKDTYKDTGKAITPHFTLEQAEEMKNSGLITVASHGYDVHEVEGLDAEPVREGMLARRGEKEADYVSFLTADAQKMFSLLGEDAGFVSYPSGKYDERARVILREAGVFATVTTSGDPMNKVVRGLPQSLYDMGRFVVGGDTTAEELISGIER
ncbi:MAG: polysaccharide deacetylase family protein [Clostridia bacterium]|nr:polysaccharide deacetylase family protein [Clostridia bacterium]